MAQGAAIGCLQPDQSFGTRSVIGQPPGKHTTGGPSGLGRKMLRKPLSQCRKDVFLIYLPLASNANAHKFLAFSTLRTFIMVSTSL